MSLSKIAQLHDPYFDDVLQVDLPTCQSHSEKNKKLKYYKTITRNSAEKLKT